MNWCKIKKVPNFFLDFPVNKSRTFEKESSVNNSMTDADEAMVLGDADDDAQGVADAKFRRERLFELFAAVVDAEDQSRRRRQPLNQALNAALSICSSHLVNFCPYVSTPSYIAKHPFFT